MVLRQYCKLYIWIMQNKINKQTANNIRIQLYDSKQIDNQSQPVGKALIVINAVRHVQFRRVQF